MAKTRRYDGQFWGLRMCQSSLAQVLGSGQQPGMEASHRPGRSGLGVFITCVFGEKIPATRTGTGQGAGGPGGTWVKDWTRVSPGAGRWALPLQPLVRPEDFLSSKHWGNSLAVQ